MAVRIITLAAVFALLFAPVANGAESGGKTDRAPLPAILNLDPVKEERSDIDSPPLSEVFRLQRARYNVALEDLQHRSKLFLSGRCEQSALLNSFKRFRTAEYGLPGRARDGIAGGAAYRDWLGKEVEFLNWLEEIVQAKFAADVAPRQELLEVQFYHLDAKARLADQKVGDSKPAPQ